MIGIDSFTIKPIHDLAERSKIHGFESTQHHPASPAPDPALLGDTQQDWQYKIPKNSQSGKGRHFVFQHRSTGIQLGVWQNGDILFVSGNASKLKTGNYHNGIIASDVNDLWSAIDTMREVLDPILEDGATWNYRVTTLELGGVVEKPFSEFWQMLSHLKYKGQHKAPALYPGESMKWGTSKSSKFSLSIYDKGRQLNDQYNINLPSDTYTRLEIKLHDDKLEEAFGENLSGFNNNSMHKVFFDRLFTLMTATENNLNVLPKTVVGLLARNIINEQKLHGDSRRIADWWIGDRKDPAYAKKILKEATALANSIKDLSLEDLVPVDSPVIHLPPGTAEWRQAS